MAKSDTTETPEVKRKITADDEADLFKLRRRLAEAQMREYQAKATHQHAKKAVESAQADLNDLIDQLENPTPTLFTSKTDQPWRATTLDELGISGKAAEKLAENEPPLTTLGAIADWTAAGRLLGEVKGIGESTATKIEEAMDLWWKEHPDANKVEPEMPTLAECA